MLRNGYGALGMPIVVAVVVAVVAVAVAVAAVVAVVEKADTTGTCSTLGIDQVVQAANKYEYRQKEEIRCEYLALAFGRIEMLQAEEDK